MSASVRSAAPGQGAGRLWRALDGSGGLHAIETAIDFISRGKLGLAIDVLRQVPELLERDMIEQAGQIMIKAHDEHAIAWRELAARELELARRERLAWDKGPRRGAGRRRAGAGARRQGLMPRHLHPGRLPRVADQARIGPRRPRPRVRGAEDRRPRPRRHLGRPRRADVRAAQEAAGRAEP